VKIGFKFQSLGKISNISAADPPVLLGQMANSNTAYSTLGQTSNTAVNKLYANYTRVSTKL